MAGPVMSIFKKKQQLVEVDYKDKARALWDELINDGTVLERKDEIMLNSPKLEDIWLGRAGRRNNSYVYYGSDCWKRLFADLNSYGEAIAPWDIVRRVDSSDQKPA